jgi:hypothetical protein
MWKSHLEVGQRVEGHEDDAGEHGPKGRGQGPAPGWGLNEAREAFE